MNEEARTGNVVPRRKRGKGLAVDEQTARKVAEVLAEAQATATRVRDELREILRQMNEREAGR